MLFVAVCFAGMIKRIENLLHAKKTKAKNLTSVYQNERNQKLKLKIR